MFTGRGFIAPCSRHSTTPFTAQHGGVNGTQIIGVVGGIIVKDDERPEASVVIEDFAEIASRLVLEEKGRNEGDTAHTQHNCTMAGTLSERSGLYNHVVSGGVQTRVGISVHPGRNSKQLMVSSAQRTAPT